MSKNNVNRRIFLMGTAAAVGTMAGCATTARPSGAQATRRTPSLKRLGYASPNEKLNVASIGAGGKGGSDIEKCGHTENVVALCDADWNRAAGTFRKFENAARYKDFREMLDRENIDACTISTPDHMHAMQAMWCMERGIHVYVQKPLTHDVFEARKLAEASVKYNVATQMGNQGHSGNGVRECCEIVWSGIIGQIREVHAWTNRPIWPQAMVVPPPPQEAPEDIDWDMWIGNAPYRPYSKEIAPFNWRGYHDYGTGALGDMACHILDPANWALQLTAPTSVECFEIEGISDFAYPNKSITRFEFPARPGFGPVTVYWYDGGLMPPRPAGVGADEKLGEGDNGSFFIGENGILTTGTYGDGTRLVGPGARDFQKPMQIIPRAPGISGMDSDQRHTMDWLYACKSDHKATSNFEYSGPFTEWVVLGAIAQRVPRQRLLWDAGNLRFTNSPEATRLVKRDYRRGWNLSSRGIV